MSAMQSKVMEKADVSYLDAMLLDGRGLVQPVAAEALKDIQEDHLKYWCVLNAIYQIPTLELIAFLKEFIGDKTAIEICAGKSGIGRALGIRATDSWMQTKGEIALYYKMLGQVPITPPDYVEKIDANDAVKKYDPDIVLGAFVTQRWLNEQDEEANMYGPLEEEWLDAGKIYIHIGNQSTHGKKRILSRPHISYKLPYLRSRAIDESKNVVWVWNDWR